MLYYLTRPAFTFPGTAALAALCLMAESYHWPWWLAFTGGIVLSVCDDLLQELN